MERKFEEELPEGYKIAKVIDARDKKLGFIFNTLGLVIMAVIMAIAALIIRPQDFIHGYKLSSNLIFLGVMVIYVVLHELVHGLAYKLATGHKLTFGMTATTAYCGVPDIYVYRKYSLIAVAAPFVVFLPVFLVPCFLLKDNWDKMYCALLLAFHVCGCCGDLYNILLYLFKFKEPTVLTRDTGPEQTIYIAE